MGAGFDRAEADAKLTALASQYKVTVKSNGGGLRNGCKYDTYVRVGDRRYYASIAIRNPKSDRPAYFAITRMANGRRVIDDQVPLTEWAMAPDYFAACVKIASLGEKARTISLLNRESQLWTDEPPAKR